MSTQEYRMRLLVLLSLSLAAACSSHSTQSNGAAGSGSATGAGSAAAPGSGSGSAGGGSAAVAAAPAPKPASALEQVRQGAPAGAAVAPAEVAVPGIDLFLVTDRAPIPDDEGMPPRAVGVAGAAGGKVLEGRELVKAAIDAKPEHKVLAQLALWVALDDGKLLDAAKTPAERKARVGPPAVAGNALGFWALTTDVPPQLEHGKLDLTTGALTLEPRPQPLKVTVSNAMTTLGSAAVSRHVHAAQTLAAACSDTRARQALLAALANHPRVKTRAAVAEEARHCGAAAVDALINAMQQDKSGLVRSEAARALGRIGDARARPALAKAVRGEDANLAYTAGTALKKIP
jgi:hypothetical protein